ncbi:MAG: hypothetical protein JXA87_05300 [Thermoleophilia bacterium]|nr:hypothetical protein [Thermoleophilia bacterium]
MGDIDLGLPELLGSQWTTIALILVVVILLLVFLLLRIRGNRKRAALEHAVQAGVGSKGKKGKKGKKAGGEAAAMDAFSGYGTGMAEGAAMGGGAAGGFLSQSAGGAPDTAFGAAPDMARAQAPSMAPAGPPSEVLGEATEELPGEPVVATSKGKGKAAKAPAPSPYANLTPGGLPAADPLKSVLNSVLQGWGDLTAEDTNRLKVFRADKVMAAIAAIELPKDLKNSEHARSRFNQLRHYANSLQQVKRTPAEPLAEFAGIGLGPVASEQAPSTGPTAGTGAVAAEAAEVIDSTETAGTAEVAEAIEAPEVESGEDYVEDETAGEGRASDSSWGVTSSGKELWGTAAAAAIWGAPPDTPEDDQPEGSTTPGTESKPVEIAWEPGSDEKPAEQPSSSAWGNTETTVAAAAAAFWAATEAPAETPAVETPPVPETPPMPETPVAAPQTAELREQVELPVMEEMVVEEELPVVEEMTGFEEVSGFEEAAGGAAAGSAGIMANAEDLLALSTDEQLAKLGALDPDELEKVFRASHDTRLKKSIIDTLEHKGFLDTIHEFFDDPDPEVQTHALDAADRLLGTE